MKGLSDSAEHTVRFGCGRIGFVVRRSKRRTLAITVKPDASVVVTAPRGAGVEAVEAKVRKRARWIRQQQEYFSQFLPKLPPRRYVSGETHRYLGRQYRLKVLAGGAEFVTLRGRHLVVETSRKGDSVWVRRLVEGWYRGRAKERFMRSLASYLPRFNGRGVNAVIRIRRMLKRWGSWTSKGIIYLNPELVLAPPSCIDYVLAHELCHLVHGYHGAKFYALLHQVMPDWRERKERLEKMASETTVC